MQLLSTPFAVLFAASPLFAQSECVVEPNFQWRVVTPDVRVQGLEPRTRSNFRFDFQPPVVAHVPQNRQVVALVPEGQRWRWVQLDPNTRTWTMRRVEDPTQAQEPSGPRPGDAWIGLELRARTDGAPRLEVEVVVPGSPGERAGLRAGDKLVALGEHGVTAHTELAKLLKGRNSGDEVQVTVERTLKAELGESDSESGVALLGVNPQDGETKRSRVDGMAGVAIGAVEESSGARAGGLRPGDRIAAVDGTEVGSFEELRGQIRSRSPGDGIELRVQRDLTVVLAPRPGQADDGRSITGTGEGVFSPSAPKQAPPELPPPGKPEAGLDYLWSQPGTPEPPKAGPKPSPQGKPKAPAPKSSKRNAAPAPGAATTAELLEEIRALRNEVSDLRREIEALRERRR